MTKPRKRKQTTTTTEETAWIRGLYQEFTDQVTRYHGFTNRLHELEARIELTEKLLCLTREQFRDEVAKAETAAPGDWEKVFNSVRFVGVRLVDACLTLLQERKKLTSQQLLKGLNIGMFRFRSNAPLREIHAALLRQRRVKKEDDTWMWVGGPEAITMRPPITKGVTMPPVEDSSEAGTDAA